MLSSITVVLDHARWNWTVFVRHAHFEWFVSYAYHTHEQMWSIGFGRSECGINV